MQKVSLKGQVLSRKIKIKKFSRIFQFEDKFQIFNFSGKIFCRKISFVVFRVGKLVQKVDLNEEVFSRKIVAKNLRSLKVNVKNLVSMKNSELENWWENIWCSTKFKSENWYQKLLSQKMGICEKIIQSWKIGINILSWKIGVKNFNDG